MKRKVIEVKHRKGSDSFPEWMKYEITLLNEDGSTEKIPAYGKDLQDALSRVVHDSRVQKIQKRTKRIPSTVWVILWFGYITALWQYSITLEKHWASITFSIGMVAITFTFSMVDGLMQPRQ